MKSLFKITLSLIFILAAVVTYAQPGGGGPGGGCDPDHTGMAVWDISGATSATQNVTETMYLDGSYNYSGTDVDLVSYTIFVEVLDYQGSATGYLDGQFFSPFASKTIVITAVSGDAQTFSLVGKLRNPSSGDFVKIGLTVTALNSNCQLIGDDYHEITFQ